MSTVFSLSNKNPKTVIYFSHSPVFLFPFVTVESLSVIVFSPFTLAKFLSLSINNLAHLSHVSVAFLPSCLPSSLPFSHPHILFSLCPLIHFRPTVRLPRPFQPPRPMFYHPRVHTLRFLWGITALLHRNALQLISPCRDGSARFRDETATNFPLSDVRVKFIRQFFTLIFAGSPKGRRAWPPGGISGNLASEW